MGALSFSRRAALEIMSKRKNPIFLRISTAKTRFSKNGANFKNRGGSKCFLTKIWRKNDQKSKNLKTLENFFHVFFEKNSKNKKFSNDVSINFDVEKIPNLRSEVKKIE